ncbi:MULTISPECIES: hypothetical protein [Pseudomonas]|jgi:hypothetical protein|uniref:hypothetical protein n=1 Tax=Pseudomonas TaxID=286 RepID=UPI0015A5F63F|nr:MULTISPECIES: hypothetical protein [Pseudomonas]MBT9575288.1 hypothetical protein [Pseudomonas umsongensis]
MLAMDVNDNACCLDKRGAFESISSEFALLQILSPHKTQKKTEFLRPAIVI